MIVSLTRSEVRAVFGEAFNYLEDNVHEETGAVVRAGQWQEGRVTLEVDNDGEAFCEAVRSVLGPPPRRFSHGQGVWWVTPAGCVRHCRVIGEEFYGRVRLAHPMGGTICPRAEVVFASKEQAERYMDWR